MTRALVALLAVTLVAAVVAASGDLLLGCGGNGWTPADSKSARDALSAQRTLLDVCSSDAGCTPPMVRAVERASTCNLASMLHRHGADVADAGDGCAP